MTPFLLVTNETRAEPLRSAKTALINEARAAEGQEWAEELWPDGSRFGPDVLNLVFRINGRVGERLVYRGEESVNAGGKLHQVAGVKMHGGGSVGRGH